MRRIFLVIITFLILAGTLQAQSKTTVTGTIQGVTGANATSGYVEFRLAPTVTGGSPILYYVANTLVLAPMTARCAINSSGAVIALTGGGACQVWGNSTVTPANSTYTVVFAPNGNITNTVNRIQISGTTYDLTNPTFASSVTITPQFTTLFAEPIEANIVPVTTNQFNVGSGSKYFAAGYFNQVFASSVNTTLISGATSLTSPIIYGGTSAGSTLTLKGTSNGSPSSAYVLINPTAGQNVGIGTSTPGAALDVRSAGNGSAFDVYTGSTLLSRIYDTNTPNAIGSQVWNLFASDVGTQTGTILYKTPGGAPGIVMYTGCCSNRMNFANSGTYTYIQYDNDADGTPALAVKAGGGVGIGTYSPTYALDIAPTANVTAGKTLRVKDATASTGVTTEIIEVGAAQSTNPLQSWQGANSQSSNIKQSTTTVAAATAGTLTASNLIPAGALVLGVTLRVTTTFSNASGLTTFSIGDGTDADRFGATIARTSGTTTTIANTTIASPVYYTAATSIVLTADAGTFNVAAGVARITVHYIDLTAPAN